MREYDVIIGLEIHAELNTKSKAFCSCSTEFGGLPNTQVCPVCLGYPGALPIVNKRAVEYTVMAGLTLGSTINNLAVFERKNYFYPDLSKSYQISQLDNPICIGGGITLGSGKYIRFNRIHMEEDAGKLIHSDQMNCTLVDFNRCGVPLIEMVTEPDFTSSEEVIEFLGILKQTLIHTGIANCKMEEGGFRMDVNISVKEHETEEFGTRVELKNINSFKTIAGVIDYEKNRQISLIENGELVKRETRGWNEDLKETYVLREKESENDYRYFADPSILPIEITNKDISRLAKRLPISITDIFAKYRRLGLEDSQIEILTNKGLTNYFDTINNEINNPKEVINWLLTDILKLLKDYDEDTLFAMLPAGELSQIIELVCSGEITRVNGKMLIDEVIKTGKTVKKLLIELDMLGDVNKIDIENFVNELLRSNIGLKEDYKQNKDNVMNFCIGQIMKMTNGKAKPEYIKPLVTNILERD